MSNPMWNFIIASILFVGAGCVASAANEPIASLGSSQVAPASAPTGTFDPLKALLRPITPAMLLGDDNKTPAQSNPIGQLISGLQPAPPLPEPLPLQAQPQQNLYEQSEMTNTQVSGPVGGNGLPPQDNGQSNPAASLLKIAEFSRSIKQIVDRSPNFVPDVRNLISQMSGAPKVSGSQQNTFSSSLPGGAEGTVTSNVSGAQSTGGGLSSLLPELLSSAVAAQNAGNGGSGSTQLAQQLVAALASG